MDVLPDNAVVAIKQIKDDTKTELAGTSDKETIFRTISQFTYQLSGKLYQEGRAITLSFTRPEWTKLDKIVKQANTGRKRHPRTKGSGEGAPPLLPRHVAYPSLRTFCFMKKKYKK